MLQSTHLKNNFTAFTILGIVGEIFYFKRYTMEYYSAMKRNKIVPLTKTWMNLETVIQSEVSQKQKNKYCIIFLICGIQKNDMEELICKAEIETQMQRTNVWTPRGKKGGGKIWEIGIDIYTLMRIKQITKEYLLYITGNSTSLHCTVETNTTL